MSTGPNFDLLREVIEGMAKVPTFWWDETDEMALSFVELTETANNQYGVDDYRRDQGKTLVAGQRRMTIQCKIIGGEGVRASTIGDRIRLELGKDGPKVSLAGGNMAINDWSDMVGIPYQLDTRVVSAMTFDLYVSYASNSDAFDEDWIETIEDPDLTFTT